LTGQPFRNEPRVEGAGGKGKADFKPISADSSPSAKPEGRGAKQV
jgi:hypothetical protein